jgi:murein DD-endopeptidase MepM/ murein hydrolase activator NlpD
MMTRLMPLLVCAVLTACLGRAAGEPLQEAGAHFVQGGHFIGRVEPGHSVRFQGEAVMTGEEGWFLVGFDRDAPDRAVLEVLNGESIVHTRSFAIAGRDYKIERIDGLPPSSVTPSPETIERLKREGAQKREAYKSRAGLDGFRQDWIWPVGEGRMSGEYGSQRILNGQPRRPHYGIDIAAPLGTPIKAPADGVVTLAGDDFFFEGGLVFIDHGLGVTSAFLHLEAVDVAPGDRVSRGEVIATVGSGGRSTGPHLDWRIKWQGRQLDPALFAGAFPGSEDSSG